MPPFLATYKFSLIGRQDTSLGAASGRKFR